jgi:hypothetical protein
MRETKMAIMEGVEATESKIVGNNTVEYIRPDGTKVIRFHRTDIIEFPKRGGVVFNSGGWKTITTKERMNTYQNVATIVQSKGMWWLSLGSNSWNEDSRIPYFDGMKVKGGKVIRPRKSAHQKDQFWIKKINEYCQKVKKMKALPWPEGGDCWYCSMQTNDGETLGEFFKDEQHLKSHLKEKYIHGSLIWNALKHAGYRDPGFILQYGSRMDLIVRAIRKYFKSNLGLAT